jgi:hypothetical protein
MRIRITRIALGEFDGVDLRTLEVGSSYDVSPAVGAHLVGTRCGELISSQEPMLLVGLEEPFGYDVAEDRGRRFDSILSFEPAEPRRK